MSPSINSWSRPPTKRRSFSERSCGSLSKAFVLKESWFRSLCVDGTQYFRSSCRCTPLPSRAGRALCFARPQCELTDSEAITLQLVRLTSHPIAFSLSQGQFRPGFRFCTFSLDPHSNLARRANPFFRPANCVFHIVLRFMCQIPCCNCSRHLGTVHSFATGIHGVSKIYPVAVSGIPRILSEILNTFQSSVCSFCTGAILLRPFRALAQFESKLLFHT